MGVFLFIRPQSPAWSWREGRCRWSSECVRYGGVIARSKEGHNLGLRHHPSRGLPKCGEAIFIRRYYIPMEYTVE